MLEDVLAPLIWVLDVGELDILVLDVPVLEVEVPDQEVLEACAFRGCTCTTGSNDCVEGIERLALDVLELDVDAEHESTGGSGGCAGTAGLGA